MLVTAVIELLVPAARLRPVVLFCTVALTGLTFIGLMLVPSVGDAYRWFFGVAQWPFRAAMAVLDGATVPAVVPVFLAADPPISSRSRRFSFRWHSLLARCGPKGRALGLRVTRASHSSVNAGPPLSDTS
jgi:hypothetical protein